MNTIKIIVPTDLTPAADQAVEYGKYLAGKWGGGLTLLHVHDDPGISEEQIRIRLREISEKISEELKTECDFMIKTSKYIFKQIPASTEEGNFGMMVIATHGIQGLRQKITGADILKLVREVPIPVIVVQQGTTVPEAGIRKILFPVGGHAAYHRKITATVSIARVFNSEVLIYNIRKPGYEVTGQLKANLEQAKMVFENEKISYRTVTEDQNVYSVGYAKQTLNYAEKNRIDMIAIVSPGTRENYFFADSDKETLLTNDLNIPVLCTSDKEIS